MRRERRVLTVASKEQINEAADWCEAQAQESLSRGIDFAVLARGAAGAQADLERAGSLAMAAKLLRDRAKATKDDQHTPEDDR